VRLKRRTVLWQGMPFEVWKTRMGRHRQEGTIEAFMNVYKRGGIGGFWAGTGATTPQKKQRDARTLATSERA
jgi:hypothetical protein